MDWSVIDLNIIINEKGMVLTRYGEPVFIKPRTIILTLPDGTTIDLLDIDYTAFSPILPV